MREEGGKNRRKGSLEGERDAACINPGWDDVRVLPYAAKMLLKKKRGESSSITEKSRRIIQGRRRKRMDGVFGEEDGLSAERERGERSCNAPCCSPLGVRPIPSPSVCKYIRERGKHWLCVLALDASFAARLVNSTSVPFFCPESLRLNILLPNRKVQKRGVGGDGMGDNTSGLHQSRSNSPVTSTSSSSDFYFFCAF